MSAIARAVRPPAMLAVVGAEFGKRRDGGRAVAFGMTVEIGFGNVGDANSLFALIVG